MANTTWSPSDKTAGIGLTGSNLIATSSGLSAGVRGVSGLSTGKYYWEYTLTTANQFSNSVGIATPTASFVSMSGNKVGTASLEAGSGTIYINNSTGVGSGLGVRASGDKIGIAVDFTAQLIWLRVAPSGNWNGSGTANPATGAGGFSISALTGTLYPMFGVNGGGDVVTANFGDSAFTGTVPSGFTAGWPAIASPTTLNPADKSAPITLSAGNLVATWNGSAGGVRSTASKSSGKIYFEAQFTTINASTWVGLANSTSVLTVSNSANVVFAQLDGAFVQGNGGNLGSNGGAMSAGQWASFAVDLTNALFWYRPNGGLWNNNASNNPATGVGGYSISYLTGPFLVYCGATAGTSGNVVAVNFGASSSVFAVPSGFSTWDPLVTGTTWNPADLVQTTLSGGNLVATIVSGQLGGVRSTISHSSGKYYYEDTWTTINTNTIASGIALASANLASPGTGMARVARSNGHIIINGADSGSAVTVGSVPVPQGSVIGCAVDLTAQLVWFRISPSGNWNGSGTANPATGTGGLSISAMAGAQFAFMSGQSLDVVTANFGASAFSGTIPAGYISWNSVITTSLVGDALLVGL